jgi:hypothetical protein
MRYLLRFMCVLALGVMGCGGESGSVGLTDYCLDTYCPICFPGGASDEQCLMYCGLYGSSAELPCESQVVAVHECELEIERCFGVGLHDQETRDRCADQLEAMEVCFGIPRSPSTE